MIHKIVFWKSGTSGISSTDSLFFYALLVAETPPSWKQTKKKVIAILPLGDNAPQPGQLIDFVEAIDDLSALNSAKATLAALPGLKGHNIQTSWAAK